MSRYSMINSSKVMVSVIVLALLFTLSAYFVSRPESFYAHSADISSHRVGGFTSKGGQTFISFTYKYVVGSNQYVGSDTHMVPRSIGMRVDDPKVKIYVKQWVDEHPVGANVNIRVNRFFSSLSGYEKNESEWLSGFLFWGVMVSVAFVFFLTMYLLLRNILLKIRNKI